MMMDEVSLVLVEAEKNELWVRAHYEELLKENFGKLVAVKGQKVAAVVDTVSELLDKLGGQNLLDVSVIALPSEEFASIL
jgi:hypothetical protein